MDIKSIDELKHEIKTVTNIEDYLTSNKEHLIKDNLLQHLHMLLEQKISAGQT